jgi:acyl carrier protein
MDSIISSRTPEGQPNHCPVCKANVCLDPSLFFGDAPCPNCGTLLWFLHANSEFLLFERESTDPIREQVLRHIAEQLGVDPGRIAANPRVINELGADSLDVVELVMELEEEFDL